MCVVLVAQTWVVCVGFLKDRYFSFLFWSFHCVSFFDLLLLFILWRLQAFHISLTILFSIYRKEGHAEMLTKIFLCNLKLIHDEVIFSPRGHKWNLITMKNNMCRTKKNSWERVLRKCKLSKVLYIKINTYWYSRYEIGLKLKRNKTDIFIVISYQFKNKTYFYFRFWNQHIFKFKVENQIKTYVCNLEL